MKFLAVLTLALLVLSPTTGEAQINVTTYPSQANCQDYAPPPVGSIANLLVPEQRCLNIGTLDPSLVNGRVVGFPCNHHVRDLRSTGYVYRVFFTVANESNVGVSTTRNVSGIWLLNVSAPRVNGELGELWVQPAYMWRNLPTETLHTVMVTGSHGRKGAVRPPLSGACSVMVTVFGYPGTF